MVQGVVVSKFLVRFEIFTAVYNAAFFLRLEGLDYMFRHTTTDSKTHTFLRTCVYFIFYAILMEPCLHICIQIGSSNKGFDILLVNKIASRDFINKQYIFQHMLLLLRRCGVNITKDCKIYCDKQVTLQLSVLSVLRTRYIGFGPSVYEVTSALTVPSE
jgi:hypothetical protein